LRPRVTPIRRSEILLGKWLGHGIIVRGYLLLLAGGVLLAVRAAAGYMPVDVARGLPFMLLEVLLLMTIAIAGGPLIRPARAVMRPYERSGGASSPLFDRRWKNM
jgi:ABC-type transport system involved in multi-copper enzyme maturation permease subunit